MYSCYFKTWRQIQERKIKDWKDVKMFASREQVLRKGWVGQVTAVSYCKPWCSVWICSQFHEQSWAPELCISAARSSMGAPSPSHLQPPSQRNLGWLPLPIATRHQRTGFLMYPWTVVSMMKYWAGCSCVSFNVQHHLVQHVMTKAEKHLVSHLSLSSIRWERRSGGSGERGKQKPSCLLSFRNREVRCGSVKPQLRTFSCFPGARAPGIRAQGSLVSWRRSACDLPLQPRPILFPCLCVRKEFITAQVWEEAQGIRPLRNVCEEVKKMHLEHVIFQSLCGFIVFFFDPAVKIDIALPAHVLAKLGRF